MSSTVVLAVPWRARHSRAPSTMRTRVDERSSPPRCRTTPARAVVSAPGIPRSGRVAVAPTDETVWRFLSHCQPIGRLGPALTEVDVPRSDPADQEAEDGQDGDAPPDGQGQRPPGVSRHPRVGVDPGQDPAGNEAPEGGPPVDVAAEADE